MLLTGWGNCNWVVGWILMVLAGFTGWGMKLFCGWFNASPKRSKISPPEDFGGYVLVGWVWGWKSRSNKFSYFFGRIGYTFFTGRGYGSKSIMLIYCFLGDGFYWVFTAGPGLGGWIWDFAFLAYCYLFKSETSYVRINGSGFLFLWRSLNLLYV